MRNDADQVTIRKLDLSDRRVVTAILLVEKLAYTQEARIIGYHRIPALRDTVGSIRSSGETFFGLYDSDSLVAVISVILEHSMLTICRLVVNPSFQRRGMASRLLNHIEVEYPNASVFRASTAAKNEPALLLYKIHRFKETSRWKTPDGLELIRFERKRSEGVRP